MHFYPFRLLFHPCDGTTSGRFVRHLYFWAHLDLRECTFVQGSRKPAETAGSEVKVAYGRIHVIEIQRAMVSPRHERGLGRPARSVESLQPRSYFCPAHDNSQPFSASS